jgi:cell wall-associated NlpC family hydrolase
MRYEGMRNEVTFDALVTVGVADVRREPSGASELVTQALLDTPVTILEQQAGWLRCRLPDYEGWIEAANLAAPTDIAAWQSDPLVVVTVPIGRVHQEPTSRTTLVTHVFLSTVLRKTSGNDGWHQVLLPDGRRGWLPKGQAEEHPAGGLFPRGDVAAVMATARRLMDVPYLWGGLTPLGFDCSGFVQIVYRYNGYVIPRDADQQFAADIGQRVKRHELLPGDLVFFGEAGDIGHVGLYLGGGEYIHCNGRDMRVAVNSFDPASPRYRADLDKSFAGARRIIEWPPDDKIVGLKDEGR